MQFLEEFRDLAARGDYESALQSFQEFGDEIGEIERDKKTTMIEGYSWKQIKNELQKEAHLVHEILNELRFFGEALSFGPQHSDEPTDYFKAAAVPQKSIQERYETHCRSRTHSKNDRARTQHKRRQSVRAKHEKNENKRRNILSPLRKERKERHHVNPRRERPNSKNKGKEEEDAADAEDDGKYRPPSGMDHHLVETIENSVIQRNIGVKWSDIASLEDVKKVLKEVVILPTIIPEYFKGIRKPFRGILLFGPPGTGKTMLAKAVASTAKCTFFNVSPSLIISKWRGDSSKLIRLLFDIARFYAPSVIFFDEIDAIASSRGGSGEHEASRQLKSELLIQMDGVNAQSNDEGDTGDDDEDGTDPDGTESDCKATKPKSSHVMVLAATNYPWLLDEALRRRLEKRIYITLPDAAARIAMFKMYLKGMDLDENVDFDKLSEMTEGYNGSDIQVICRNAAMIPMRNKLQNIDMDDLENLKCSDLDTKLTHEDIVGVAQKIKSSVAQQDVNKHREWFDQFGALG